VPLSLDTISHAGFFLLILLMFIGASPGGTGGGIKTTTFAVLLCTTRSTLEDRTEVVINRRRIPGKQVLRAVGITLASAGVVVLMTMLLGLGDTEAGVLGDEDFTFLEKLFTCVSAFASVGFDLGITARLDRWGQLVLLVGMFIGRLGILLLLSALFGRRPPSRVRYPQEELIL
jgi:Trk-type K+ transport system membrane component